MWDLKPLPSLEERWTIIPPLFSNSRSSIVYGKVRYLPYVEHLTTNINVLITVTLCDSVLSIPYTRSDLQGYSRSWMTYVSRCTASLRELMGNC
jgi:hypothetical protein